MGLSISLLSWVFTNTQSFANSEKIRETFLFIEDYLSYTFCLINLRYFCGDWFSYFLNTRLK